MTWTGIHKDDYGWTARMIVRQNGDPLDISNYSTFTFILIPPSGVANKKELPAAFETDGTDGALVHTVLETVINEAGDWLAAPRVKKAATEITGDEFTFPVTPRLDGA